MYLQEFLTVALAHLLAVASPGPDFAVVVRQSVTFGRRAGTWTAAGIGTGILLHVTYSVLGLGVLLHRTPAAFRFLTWAGAAYLAWLAVQALRSAPRTPGSIEALPGAAPTPRAAFVTGLLTNALNGKALLFFVSLFAVGVSPRTPVAVLSLYGAWMAVATAAWFCLVARFFSAEGVRAAFLRHGHWFDRAVGVVLLALAARVAWAALA